MLSGCSNLYEYIMRPSLALWTVSEEQVKHKPLYLGLVKVSGY
jgi:hypothetical protein